MATAKKPVKKPAKKQTLREKSQAAQTAKPRRIRSTAGKIKKPLSGLRRLLGKLRIPLPNNKFGRAVRKVGRIFSRILLPYWLRNSWKELRQVTWPGRRETWRLTMAVFIFSVVFAVIVGFLDFGLDKAFKAMIVKE